MAKPTSINFRTDIKTKEDFERVKKILKEKDVSNLTYEDVFKVGLKVITTNENITELKKEKLHNEISTLRMKLAGLEYDYNNIVENDRVNYAINNPTDKEKTIFKNLIGEYEKYKKEYPKKTFNNFTEERSEIINNVFRYPLKIKTDIELEYKLKDFKYYYEIE